LESRHLGHARFPRRFAQRRRGGRAERPLKSNEALTEPDHEPESVKSAEWLGLAAVLAVAAAVRIFAWSSTAVLFNDGPIFLALAEAIGAGRWSEVLAHPYHPLYPALIAFVAVFSVELETAAIVISIAGGLISVAAVFWFVRDFFSRDVAWLAAWILALHPWAIDFSADVMSDGIYMGLFLLGFLTLAKLVEQPTLIKAVACGVLCGLSYLVRPEGAGLFLVATALLGWRAVGDRELRRSSVVGFVALLLAGLVVAGPFAMAVSRATGEFSITQKKSISRLIADPSSAQVLAEERLSQQRLSEVARVLPLPELAIRADGPGAIRPDRNWLGALEAVVRVSTTAMSAFRWELMVLALIGMLGERSNRRPRRDRAIGLVVAGYMGLLVLLVWGAGYVSRRHALPALLPLIGYSALGVRILWRTGVARLADGQAALISRLQAPQVVCVVLVPVLILAWGARDLRDRRIDRLPVRAAAEWLAKNRPGTGPVAAQKLRVAYYAGAKFIPLTTGHDGRLEDHLRQRGARWVVIDRAKLADHRGLAEGIGHWLQPVHTSTSQGRVVFVLSIEPTPAG
jgi:4-amino-4-deoxy-L-arabinose transferase-like glycosyltransferase